MKDGRQKGKGDEKLLDGLPEAEKLARDLLNDGAVPVTPLSWKERLA